MLPGLCKLPALKQCKSLFQQPLRCSAACQWDFPHFVLPSLADGGGKRRRNCLRAKPEFFCVPPSSRSEGSPQGQDWLGCLFLVSSFGHAKEEIDNRLQGWDGWRTLTIIYTRGERADMEHFIAYHSVQKMGYEYGTSGTLVFLSKKVGLLKKALGNIVWAVQGMPDGKKTAYSLCGAYIADSLDPEDPSSNLYIIRGSQGTGFVPPLPLNQLSWFPALLKSQSNFSLGFNRLNDETVIQGLSTLKEENSKPPVAPSLPDIDFSASTSEGARRLVSHLRRERDNGVVQTKKTAVLHSSGVTFHRQTVV